MSLWCEVRVAVPLAQVELAAAAFGEVAPGGVAIEEPVTPLGPEEGVRLEPHRPAAVSCYLPVDDELGARLEEIDARLAAYGLDPEIETKRVAEASWESAWKEHFHVERVGRRLVIRPSWREFTPSGEDVVINLDPGMAFGTGQHPTTRGCLLLLDEQMRPGLRVLDLGCGSGILAVAAGLLGAPEVVALDIEAQAIQVTHENAAMNRVGAIIRAARGSLGDAWPMADVPAAGFDLTVANIHARALIELAAPLTASVKPEGVLICSGIIAEREADVVDALGAHGFRVRRTLPEGDWRTILLTR